MPTPVPVTIDFPLSGLNTATEAGLQPVLTTPLGVNVRAQDPLARRVRGGSRTGLSRLVNARVNGVNPVQNLGVVVTQDWSALAAELDSIEQPGVRVSDPSTSSDPNLLRVPPGGRTFPAGGSGATPSRLTGTNQGASPPPPPAGPWAFVQQKSGADAGPVASLALAFASNVTNGSLVLAAVATYGPLLGAAPTVAVADNQGHPYLQAGGYSSLVDAFGNPLVLSLWYTAWNALTGPATLTATVSASVAVRVGLLEYAGVLRTGATAAIDGSDAASDPNPAPNPATMTGGTPAVLFADDAAFGCYTTVNEVDAFSAPAGYTARITDGANVGPNLLVVDKFNVGAAAAVTGLVDGYNLYAGLSATFKKG